MVQVYAHTTSELGLERRCLACHQFWPADQEFYAPRNNKRDPLSLRCRACIAELFWGFSERPSTAGPAFCEETAAR